MLKSYNWLLLAFKGLDLLDQYFKLHNLLFIMQKSELVQYKAKKTLKFKCIKRFNHFARKEKAQMKLFLFDPRL